MSIRKAKSLHRSRTRTIHAGWIVVFAAILLTLLCVDAIGTTRPNTGTRQFMLGAVGMVCGFAIAFVPQERYRQASWWLYALSLLLLLFLLIPFVPEFLVRPRNGARRWINLGFIDMQPSI